MSFSSLVDFLILKMSSLLLSETLMSMGSVCAGASWPSAAGELAPWWSEDIGGTEFEDDLAERLVC